MRFSWTIGSWQHAGTALRKHSEITDRWLSVVGLYASDGWFATVLAMSSHSKAPEAAAGRSTTELFNEKREQHHGPAQRI